MDHMDYNHMTNVQKLTLSAMVIALYVVVLFFTQSFSFGAYQIRIGTSLYALAYLFPFLVLPLGLSNCLSNILFGGMGPLDICGGFIVGLITSGTIAFIRKRNFNPVLTMLPIIFIPGLGAALWLSILLNIPYPAMALNLCIGQTVPGICGPFLIKIVQRIIKES